MWFHKGLTAGAMVLALALSTSAQAKHPHAHHHPGCNTVRCDHHIDRLWAAKQRRNFLRRMERQARQGWAIPAPIVQCESGGANLAPNGSDASGYYQILGSTWADNGGPPPYEAYLHPKWEQDRIARHIWRTAGSSQWVCAHLVAWS